MSPPQDLNGHTNISHNIFRHKYIKIKIYYNYTRTILLTHTFSFKINSIVKNTFKIFAYRQSCKVPE